MGFGVFLSIGRRMKKSHMGRGRWRGGGEKREDCCLYTHCKPKTQNGEEDREIQKRDSLSLSLSLTKTKINFF
jgi:hypothetical protein